MPKSLRKKKSKEDKQTSAVHLIAVCKQNAS